MSKHIQTVPIGCSTITWWSGHKRVTLIQLLYLSSWSQLQWSGHKKYVQHQRRLVSEIVVWSKYIIICCCYSNTQLPPAKHITCITIWKSWVRSQNVRVFTILILILMDDHWSLHLWWNTTLLTCLTLHVSCSTKSIFMSKIISQIIINL